MPDSPLPADVQRFLLTSVPSVPFLEALLLFHRERPRGLTLTEVSRRLYLPEADTAQLIEDLERANLIEPADGSGRRITEREELITLLDRVAASYARHLIPMTHLIHGRTHRSATQFAAAFRLRNER